MAWSEIGRGSEAWPQLWFQERKTQGPGSQQPPQTAGAHGLALVVSTQKMPLYLHSFRRHVLQWHFLALEEKKLYLPGSHCMTLPDPWFSWKQFSTDVVEWNQSTAGKAEGRLVVQSYFHIHSEFKAILSYIKLCLKTNCMSKNDIVKMVVI